MKKESGNVLIFILIAIVLLGALTAALVRSGGSSNDTGDYEQRSIQASDILAYASGLQTAVKQLISRGCSEEQISFQYDEDSDGSYVDAESYYNSQSPTDLSCHVFHTSGGGQTYKTFDAVSTITLSGERNVIDIGTSAAELNFNIRTSDLNLCLQLNTAVGVDNPSSAPPDCGANTWGSGKFTGSYSDGGNSACLSSDPGYSAVEKKKAFCLVSSNHAGVYSFGYVLHVR